MPIYREFENGWLLAMNDESCTRVIPSVFRFGRTFYGHATIEFWQSGGGEGMRAFVPGETEDSVRTFLVELGFVEARRYQGEGDMELKEVAEVLGLKPASTGEYE
jgi:hypothetical protein